MNDESGKGGHYDAVRRQLQRDEEARFQWGAAWLYHIGIVAALVLAAGLVAAGLLYRITGL